MATNSRFQRPAAKAAPTKKKSRYAGVTAAGARDPMPHAGEYIFRVLDAQEGSNPGTGTDSFKATLEVVESSSENHDVGDTVAFIQLISGKGGPAGLSRTKAFIMAATGIEDEEAYDSLDPDGLFIEACTGASNAFSEAFAELTGGNPIVGRLVRCKVLRGRPTAKDPSDYYRDFAWGLLEDEHQDIPGLAEVLDGGAEGA